MEKWPKRYRAEFIAPGVVSYDDVGKGKVFVSREALDKIKPTYIGRPIITQHEDMTPDKAYSMSKNESEMVAEGVIYDVGTLPNGWDYADSIVWGEDAQRLIESGYSISCAYDVLEVAGRGSVNGIDYDEEVLNGEGNHIAIVNNPRYERAKIYEMKDSMENSKNPILDGIFNQLLMNSKKGDDMANIFKFLSNSKGKDQNKNEAPPAEPKKEEEKVYNMDESFLEVNGEKIPVAEAINMYKQSKMQNQPAVLNADDVVDVDGEQVPVSELIAACNKMKAGNQTANAELPQDVKAEPVIDTQNKNQNQNAQTPKKNENFLKVQNAVNNSGLELPILNTKKERLKRGSERYSLNKKGGNE